MISDAFRPLAAAVLALVGAGLPAAPASAQAPACTLHAAPAGSDLASGTVVAPVRTVQRLADALAPGETGCLAPGVYAGGVTVTSGGTEGARVTIRAAVPGTATIAGQVRIDDGADFVTFSDLRLDGTNPGARPSPLVNGDDARFERNDVTSAVETCFVLGDEVWGVAERTVIARNRIHHCGVDGTNQDHGVYVRQAVDTLVEGNVIRANPDRGVQLFPNADRTIVRGNLIDGNGQGVIFSGDSTDTSDENVVERNVIANSDLRWNVESHWQDGLVGHGNVVRDNCLWGGRRGSVQTPTVGFTVTGTVVAYPALALRPGGRVQGPGRRSRCTVALPAR